jgi:Peptidase family M28
MAGGAVVPGWDHPRAMSASEPAQTIDETQRVSPRDVAAHLQGFAGRGAGTDAERRAAWWLARLLNRRGRRVSIETFWCRPNWALAQAWHVALALAGSLVSVATPRAGGAMLLAALVFVLADALTGVSPGRRLTRERASQNVVVTRAKSDQERLHLIVTANYDAGRTGLAYRNRLRELTGRARRGLAGFTVGWQGWLIVAIAWLLITAIVRLQGHQSAGIGAIQLIPTVGLLVALALLLELAAAAWSPGAGDNGSGVGVAVAVARAVSTSPPQNVNVEVVLTGSGDGEGAGLRQYLRQRRKTHQPANAVVLGIAPCPSGSVRWWRSDGPLLPVRYGPRLSRLAQQVADEQPRLGARVHDGRGTTPALAARRARIPSLTIGCLDDRDLVPGSHQPADVADALDRAGHDRTTQFVLMLIDAIDAALVK